MIPRPHQALADLAGRIGTRIAPELPDPYSSSDAGLISLLMTMLCSDMDTGVQRRLQDGEDLAAIFEVATQAPDRESRDAFIASRPSSLSLTDVTAWLDQGLTLLIELHAWAEESDAELNERIWEFLFAHTERHKFDI